MTQITWDGSEVMRNSTGATTDGLGDHASGQFVHGYEYGSLTEGLAAYYPLDAGSGSTATDEALGNDGTINGASWNGSGQVGADCLSFDGSSAYVSVPHRATLNPTNGTISAWVNTNAVDGNNYSVIDKTAGSNSYRIEIDATDEFRAAVSESGGFTAAKAVTPTSGSWYHVAATWKSGGEITLYVDGTDQASTSIGTTSMDDSNAANIGRNAGGNGQEWNGLVDDVRIYDRALSQPEIEALSNLTEPSTVTAGDTL